MQDMVENHWVATNELAAGLELGDDVRDSLYQTFERWDGKGAPAEARGAEIRVAARLVNLADVVEVFHRAGGVQAATAVARERSGTQFDPDLVDVFCDEAASMFAELDAVTSWDAVIAGHTHGGQITLEYVHPALNPAKFITPYVFGLYRKEKSSIFVTSGIGTITLPMRLGVPPEIAVLTLRRA